MLLLLFLLLLSTYVLNTHILKVGIIGVGRIGRCHCASVASVPTKAKVVMICDIYQPALDEVSAIFHVPKTTNDPMEVRWVLPYVACSCRFGSVRWFAYHSRT